MRTGVFGLACLFGASYLYMINLKDGWTFGLAVLGVLCMGLAYLEFGK